MCNGNTHKHVVLDAVDAQVKSGQSMCEMWRWREESDEREGEREKVVTVQRPGWLGG